MKLFAKSNADQPCMNCRHVRFGLQTAADRCARNDERFFCTVERSYGRINALLTGSCGKHGRFFVPRSTGPEHRESR